MVKNKKVYDEIVRVAYDLFEKRGRIHGYAHEDWLEAERIVLERHVKEIEKEVDIIRATKKKSSGEAETKTVKTSVKTQKKTTEKTSAPKTRKPSSKKKI